MSASRQLEQKIRSVIDSDQSLKNIDEREYCDTVLDALEGISEGLKMRLEELKQEEE